MEENNNQNNITQEQYNEYLRKQEQELFFTKTDRNG